MGSAPLSENANLVSENAKLVSENVKLGPEVLLHRQCWRVAQAVLESDREIYRERG